jgi:predicted cupin superfamily sugar epimerase
MLTPEKLIEHLGLERLPVEGGYFRQTYCAEEADPVELLLLYPDGGSKRVILGPDVMNGQQVQFVAPRDVWQGSHLVAKGQFALLGTTMAPGFTESDYVGGEREELNQTPHTSHYWLEAKGASRVTATG